jgi:hypothetical protein
MSFFLPLWLFPAYCFPASRETDDIPHQCAAAMRWAGIREYVYGTSIQTLVDAGWQQIRITSAELWQRSTDLAGPDEEGGDGPIGPVLAVETDPYFVWQYDASAPCPGGCTRGDNAQCS